MNNKSLVTPFITLAMNEAAKSMYINQVQVFINQVHHTNHIIWDRDIVAVHALALDHAKPLSKCCNLAIHLQVIFSKKNAFFPPSFHCMSY